MFPCINSLNVIYGKYITIDLDLQCLIGGECIFRSETVKQWAVNCSKCRQPFWLLELQQKTSRTNGSACCGANIDYFAKTFFR